MSVEKATVELARVRREVSRLREQLAQAQALETKIANYIEIAQRYEEALGDASHLTHKKEASQGPAEKPKMPTSGTSYDAVRATISILREAGKPVRTRDLVPILAEKGINIGGENPVTNLSGFLSRSPDLIANRALGWHLAEWNDSHTTENSDDELEEIL